VAHTEMAAAAPVRRLRIAVLNRQFKPTGGGAERYSIALVEQLALRHEIHVFAQQIEHQLAAVHYHRVSMLCRRPRWVNQLWFALATWWWTRDAFDVVHSHENSWHGQVQTVHVLPIKFNLFRGRTGLAWVLRCLKVASSPRLIAYMGLEWGRYRVKQAAAVRDGLDKCIVVTAPGLRPIMAQTYPGCKEALTVVTPGVLCVPGLASTSDKATARLQLRLPASGHCILFIGNDYRKKGLPALLQALPLLADDSWLAVVGNAAQIAEFRPMAQTLGVQDRVHFLGALADVGPAYRAADCLAHPTLEDTFAMVVLEAMAHGLPVVLSDATYCGIAELLRHGDNAWLLPDPHDTVALAGAIAALLSRTPLRAQLSTAGQRFAQSYLWSAQASTLEAIYLRMAEPPAKP
jgi:glycosyltransferase involved in cell wall biosynthesis